MRLRYRLQRKERVARPNILGNTSFPVLTYQWRDVAISDDREALEAMMPDSKDYRIEDAEAAFNDERREE